MPGVHDDAGADTDHLNAVESLQESPIDRRSDQYADAGQRKDESEALDGESVLLDDQRAGSADQPHDANDRHHDDEHTEYALPVGEKGLRAVPELIQDVSVVAGNVGFRQ